MTALFGKTSESPEFVREGSFGEPELTVEAALLARVERGDALGPARFLIAGAGYARVGAWVPSHDALGRAFPLAISLPLHEHSLLSIVPLHYAELLDAAVEGLYARCQGVRGVPYLTPPHASVLLPRLHRARSRLWNEPAQRFQQRVFGACEGGALAYALATLLRAAELEEPVALVLPGSRAEDLFAWVEVLGALAPTHTLSLIWRDGREALLGWDMELTTLLASEHRAWPLSTDDPVACGAGRARVGEDLWHVIERNHPMLVVLEQLARVVRHPYAG